MNVDYHGYTSSYRQLGYPPSPAYLVHGMYLLLLYVYLYGRTDVCVYIYYMHACLSVWKMKKRVYSKDILQFSCFLLLLLYCYSFHLSLPVYY